MTQLSQFSAEDIENIVSLPYRAGLNISYAEDEEGERDDELEMRALEVTLRAFTKHHEGQGLVKEIASEILNSKDKWSTWSQGVFNIEPLCDKAMASIKEHATDDEIKGYVKMVLDITSAVAQAYGEFGEGAEKGQGFFGKIGDIMKSVVTAGGNEAAHPMNVSAAEDSAITAITVALQKYI